MKFKSFAQRLSLVLALTLGCAAFAHGDTIRTKDGQVIRGQIISFRDQQFTILIGTGTRGGGGGRRSRITLYMEDVESIEFDAAGDNNATTASTSSNDTDAGVPRVTPNRTEQQQPMPRSSDARPTLGNNTGGTNSSSVPRNSGGNTNSSQPNIGNNDSQLFPVRVRIRADNTANGWTDSGLMVRKGQLLRVSASGRVSLGQGRFSTPTGLPKVFDTEKLMRNEPTGALIAVIGDDNDDFVFVGASREFRAPRDGRLFFGVNEGKLDDNTGTYDALIEVEPISSGGN